MLVLFAQQPARNDLPLLLRLLFLAPLPSLRLLIHLKHIRILEETRLVCALLCRQVNVLQAEFGSIALSPFCTKE